MLARAARGRSTSAVARETRARRTRTEHCACGWNMLSSPRAPLLPKRSEPDRQRSPQKLVAELTGTRDDVACAACGSRVAVREDVQLAGVVFCEACRSLAHPVRDDEEDEIGFGD